MVDPAVSTNQSKACNAVLFSPVPPTPGSAPRNSHFQLLFLLVFTYISK